MALSRDVSEIFNVEKCHDLEIWVRSVTRGQLRVVSFDRLYIISYFLVTLSIKRTVFEISDFKNAVTLITGLGVRQGHWKCHRSIERI